MLVCCPHCNKKVDVNIALRAPRVRQRSADPRPNPETARRVRVLQLRVAAAHGMSLSELLMDGHSPDLAGPRQLAMYVARTLTKKSFPILGALFQRDHTTVMHGVRAVEKRIAEDPYFASLASTLLDTDTEPETESAVDHAPANPRSRETEPSSCTRLATTTPAPVALAAVGGE